MRWPVPLLAPCLLLVAAPCFGVQQTVGGTVRAARSEGSVVRLRFEDPDVPDVILLIGWFSNFPPEPERYYVGKTLSVRGSAHRFHDRVEIHVRDATDVVVLSATPPAPEAAPSGPGEVERLRERLRNLEQRVKELEQERREPAGRHD